MHMGSKKRFFGMLVGLIDGHLFNDLNSRRKNPIATRLSPCDHWVHRIKNTLQYQSAAIAAPASAKASSRVNGSGASSAKITAGSEP